MIRSSKRTTIPVRTSRPAEKHKRGRRPIPMLRQRIIRSATELFGAKGFEQVLTDEVALHAGVGKGSVYRQFGSKEQLYAATVIEGFKHLCNQIEAAIGDAQSDRERLTTIVRHAMTYFWDRRSSSSCCATRPSCRAPKKPATAPSEVASRDWSAICWARLAVRAAYGRTSILKCSRNVCSV